MNLPMTRRFQFSLRSFLSFVAALSISLAAILQVPHWFVFVLSGVSVILTSRAAYRARARPRLLLGLIAAAIPAWIAFYALSLGPFIALSESDHKITGRHHLGRLAQAYLPAMRLNHLQAFRWYASQWIPADAAGLHTLHASQLSPGLVGTWHTGTANHVNLRSDGTGRAIDRTGERPDYKAKVLYFEWTSDGSELVIYQYASKRSPSAWFGRAALNRAPTDKFDVIEVSAAQCKLAYKTGAIILLTRTQDNELEAGP
jgi:hypothetical protein